jgi:hypothetical protein
MRAIRLVIAFVALWPGHCFAENFNCDAVLAKDTVLSHSSDRVALASLQLVTQDNYQEFKSNFTAGVKFPIDDIPISADTSFAKFSSERETYTKSLKVLPMGPPPRSDRHDEPRAFN